MNTNLSRFIDQDTIIFKNLMKDIFPNTKLIKDHNPVLSQAIVEDLEGNNY